jgi:hypothetical protein
MVLLFVELLAKVLVEIGVGGVLRHAENEAFAQRDVMKIVLDCEALEPALR